MALGKWKQQFSNTVSNECVPAPVIAHSNWGSSGHIRDVVSCDVNSGVSEDGKKQFVFFVFIPSRFSEAGAVMREGRSVLEAGVGTKRNAQSSPIKRYLGQWPAVVSAASKWWYQGQGGLWWHLLESRRAALPLSSAFDLIWMGNSRFTARKYFNAGKNQSECNGQFKLNLQPKLRFY